MRVDHLFAGRPREDSEAAILRGDQAEALSLIVKELRGGQVARAAVLDWMGYLGFVTNDGFSKHHLFDGCAAGSSDYLGAEGEDFVGAANHRRAVNGGEAGYH